MSENQNNNHNSNHNKELEKQLGNIANALRGNIDSCIRKSENTQSSKHR